MNNKRRKALSEISDKLKVLKSQLEDIVGDEEEYMDNMPESLQGSEKYDIAEQACDSLYDAVSGIEEAISAIEEAAQ
ncbi:hypothetical protein [Hominibacterium faecale]|uniref:hypothetical protein n=1 Tax=Hominibacterium faecale TaxID=2839743 RepID=UPI0022B29690|nr:hypothetical protein [Hominibacterium faecale]